MTNPGKFYATYFDVVEVLETAPYADNWLRRWQWVAMPKHPQSTSHWVFNRTQNYWGHRAMWKNMPYPDLTQMIQVYTTVADGTSVGRRRVTHDPVVVGLTLEELAKIVLTPRETPWRVLDLARRVAQRQGWKI